MKYAYILSLLIIGQCVYADAKDETINRLVRENARLRAENAELRKKLGESDLEKVAKANETKEDREVEAIRKLQRDGLVCSLKKDGNLLDIRVNQEKWDMLSSDQKNKTVMAFAAWFDKYLPPSTRATKTIVVESEYGRMAFYDESQIQFCR
jgi:hypothetical protein